MDRNLPCLLLALVCTAAAAAESAAIDAYVFTDAPARLRLPAAAGAPAVLDYQVRLLARRGLGPAQAASSRAVDGAFPIPALGEGIHIVTSAAPALEVRFLAIDPPPPIDAQRLRAALPRSGERLLGGEPFTILALGDSVTGTGDHEGLLALLLGRATGNTRIRVVDRSYPGRSADAAVRHFAEDAGAAQPDLGLMMYGLNDQVCFVPLDAFLEHYRYVAEHLASDFAADCVFLQPTPDIGIPLTPAQRKPDANPREYAVRTIAFAEALRPLAAELRVPLAETFAALWGDGGETVEDAARALWTVFPRGYSRQTTSLVESDGEGDTIHPNALGHLALARAVYAALAGQPPSAPLVLSGSSAWTPTGGVRSRLTATNASATRRAGRLEVHPQLDATLSAAGPLGYDLAPGASATIEIDWPTVRSPRDLLAHPHDIYLAPGRPLIPLIDVHQGGSRVHAVAAPFAVEARFVRARSVVPAGAPAVATLLAAGKELRHAVPIPAGSEVGRVPLVEAVEDAGRSGWAVAELAYVRYAQALPGAAEPDGDLGEWEGHHWSPLGDPCQARFATGPADRRADPAECRLRWACKAGSGQLSIAMRVEGGIAKDRFTIFLDARQAGELGTVGPYYWVSGALQPDGAVTLSKGETTRGDHLLRGRWQVRDGITAIELAIPLAICGTGFDVAPGRDFGLSLWWVHQGPGGTTHLQWSEDGHPWNPRWFGVVRCQEGPDAAALPWMVRVR